MKRQKLCAIKKTLNESYKFAVTMHGDMLKTMFGMEIKFLILSGSICTVA